MATLPPLPNLQAFEAVARRKSFAGAASELHVTASAVSHQVARLEAFLGVRLFERSSHAVVITDAGESFLARVQGALSAITAASMDVKQGVSKSLYIHSAPSIASLWLMLRLNDFARSFPEISFNLSAAHTPSNFELGEADIDIRYGIPNWPGLQVEPLFEERIIPLASPEFIRENRLRKPEDLRDVKLIRSNVSVIQWADWLGKFSKVRPPEQFPVRFDRAQMSLDAATQGLGVALESATVAAQHIKEGKLEPVFGLSKCIKVKAHFAVYPSHHIKRPAVAAFLGWLRQQARIQ
ncbi:LysR substrate-binding domain-containing protein [Herbaspirillum sp. alder98]|uniref:LysR substrate-binding domain-containing protein n=1 Tax=Herbaspirillum sp. alder98 TaxID=2913096 RepID=UPI001CD888D2|nr:LysR substrate-binding domain-containing protein [Herbaspirillum sp. alder98]MCA1326389.1 LysR family transcriptional regulator [Herbaspirillum sp. alder98]